MREILFRGKDQDGGWSYGFYARAVDLHSIEKWDPFRREMVYTPVIPETVGQYTGLDDKNGKKIFEGDIVRVEKRNEEQIFPDSEPFTGVVVKEGVLWLIKSERGDFDLHYSLNIFIHYRKGTVIGNIHDNPELLEERIKQ